MSWYDVLLRVAAVIAVFTAVGGAWALVRGSYNVARVKELREDNDDLRKRLSDTDHKLEVETAARIACENKVEGQQREIEHLTALVLQRVEIDDLRQTVGDVLAEIKAHNIAALEHWGRMDTAFNTLVRNREGGPSGKRS